MLQRSLRPIFFKTALSFVLASLHAQASATSSEVLEDPLYSRKVKGGQKEPLFDHNGKLLQPQSIGQKSTQSKVVYDAKKRPNNIFTTLPRPIKLLLLEKLMNDPKAQFNLMLVSHGFRRLAIPMKGRRDLKKSTPEALIKHLITVRIGAQTRDIALFMGDYGSAFKDLPLERLQDCHNMQLLKGALSRWTKEGRHYRDLERSRISAYCFGTPENFALHLRNCHILVPLDFDDIHKIRHLVLRGNSLIVLPSISHLALLETLQLSNNCLVRLPALTQLKNLSHLDVSHNKLDEAPDLQGLTKLRTLDLSFNLLSDPPNISDLRELRHLNLANNWLRSIPNLDQHTNLTHLDLWLNFTDKAPQINSFTLLERLALSSSPARDYSLFCDFQQLRQTQKAQGAKMAKLYSYWRGFKNEVLFTEVSFDPAKKEVVEFH